MVTFWKAMLLAAGLLLPMQAWGQATGTCAPHDAQLESLERRYSEYVIGRATVYNGNRLEVLASPRGETWSILIVFPDGVSCLVSAGEDWRNVTPPIPGQDS